MNMLNIRPGEGRTVSLMMAHYFFMGAAMLLSSSASLALFFEAWDSATLSYVYLGIAVIVSSITALFLKFSERTSLARFLIPCIALLLFGTIAFRIGLALTTSKWLLLALPIWSNTLITLSITAFWTLAGNIFDIRQSKRVFGLMNGGSWLAYVVVGFFITPLVNAFGAENLYTFIILCLVIGLAFLLAILRANPHTTQPHPVALHSQPISVRSLLRKRYIVLIFGLMAIWHMAFYFLDNIFYDRAAFQFTDAEALAGFIGRFFAAAGLLGFITDTFLTGRIISRFGLRAGLLITPTLTTLCVAGLALTGKLDPALLTLTFWLAVLARFANEGLGFSLDQSSFGVLNQPLEEKERARVQAITEGIIRPLATGLAGMLLLFFTNLLDFTALELSYLYLLTAVVWVGVALSLLNAYPQALKEALRKRRFGDAGLSLMDLASYELLQRSLSSPHPDEVIYALELLEQSGRENFIELARQALRSEHPQVRVHILKRVEQLHLVEALPAIKNQLKYETDASIREAASSALTAMRSRYAHLIYDMEPAVQRGALAGLLRGHHEDKFPEAKQRLGALAVSPSAERRREAARLIAKSGNTDLVDILQPLLSDPEATVRADALHAAGRIKHPDLWAFVVSGLDALATRRAAFAALIEGGEAALGFIMHGIADHKLPLHSRMRLARACARIRSRTAIHGLKEMIDHPHIGLRSRILVALHTCGFSAEAEFIPRLEAQIEQEVQRAAWSLTRMLDLQHTPGTDLLVEALRRDLAETHNRLFFLFSFLYDPMTLRWTMQVVKRSDETRRAYAIEALDGILSNAHKRILLPILEQQTEADLLQSLGAVSQTERMTWDASIRNILSSPYMLGAPWVGATALHVAQTLRLPETNSPANHSLEPLAILLRTESGMLSTFERVLLLKTISIFATTPEEALTELADHLEELEFEAGQTLVEKGAEGDSLFVVVRGKVEVLDGENRLNELGERAVFGELSLLDSEPRSATIRAMEDTTVLKLSQIAFYDLMTDYVEVAMGTIQMLTRNLRARTRDVAGLSRMLK